jgi:hypothetical protein
MLRILIQRPKRIVDAIHRLLEKLERLILVAGRLPLGFRVSVDVE